MFKKIIFIILTLNSITTWGQTHAVWGIGSEEDISFNYNRVIVTQNPKSALPSRVATICTYQGKLDLYLNYNILYDYKDQPITGWDVAIDSLQSACFLKIDQFRFGILYVYRGRKDTTYSVLLSEYDKRINGGKGGIVAGRHKIRVGGSSNFEEYKAYDLVKRLYDNKFIIIIRNSNKIALIVYEYGKPIAYKDTIIVKEYFTEPSIPPGLESLYSLAKGHFQSMNHSGNNVILKSGYAMYKENIFKPDGDTLIQVISTLSVLEIDKLNLKFKDVKLIHKTSYNYKTDTVLNRIGGYGYHYEYSPNDSFIYLANYRQHLKNGISGSAAYEDTCIYQLSLNKLNNIYSIPKYRGLTRQFSTCVYKLMPDGKIYFTEWRWNPISKSVIAYLDCNAAPNTYGNAQFRTNIYLFPIKEADFLTVDKSPTNRWYDYVKPKPAIEYGCIAKVIIKNASDLSLKMDKFTWYLSRTKEGKFEDTITTFEPTVTYAKSGKYPYKVYGYSSAAVYGEWYEDTLNINIPKKPVTNFFAIDTVICRFLPLQFKNFSFSLGSKPGSTPLYLWTFGDGTTSNEKEPTHFYSKPGFYTVSLFYSNGYCDSTLVKNQYIRVVDAPEPGFNVANKQGCSPFFAEFTDTVSLNVTKKEYLFTDSAIWKTISAPKFNYTFQKPGHYWAVQKLYGYTGCIIRTDSVQFFISKGLVLTDSVAITLASYDTFNQLHLEWQSHPAATSYSLYKSADGISFNLLKNIIQTRYTDLPASKKSYYYKVLAADSCGKLSSAKNIVKPQWLSGERLPQNEAAILTYFPDEGLGSPQNIELEWTYQHAINLTLGETNPTNFFRDENFATPGYLKKCYRYTANHDGVKMYSNYECVNFEPQTFIPNSFTPNGDGLNDKFLPAMVGIVSYNMKIFNRWGQLIYSGSSPWDGRAEGIPAEGEVFMYSIHIVRNDRISEFYRGTVHVIK